MGIAGRKFKRELFGSADLDGPVFHDLDRITGLNGIKKLKELPLSSLQIISSRRGWQCSTAENLDENSHPAAKTCVSGISKNLSAAARDFGV